MIMCSKRFHFLIAECSLTFIVLTCDFVGMLQLHLELFVSASSFLPAWKTPTNLESKKTSGGNVYLQRVPKTWCRPCLEMKTPEPNHPNLSRPHGVQTM